MLRRFFDIIKNMKKEKSPEFKNAILYNIYASKYPVYKTAIKRLISYFKKYQQEEPKLLFDIACGTGMGLKEIRKSFSRSKIIALDKSSIMIDFAKKKLLKHNNISFLNSSIEDVDTKKINKGNGAFCSAAFWYLNREKALDKINQIILKNGLFIFNISEPAIDFKDGKYDDRFLQTMVEVLDDFGIIFHRKEGFGRGRLKLSYRPPSIKDIQKNLKNNNFELIKINIWHFTKSFNELKEFYLIPGFGTKAFRELTNKRLKAKIINEIIRRLKTQSIKRINFRWAEFICRKKE